MKMRNLEMVPVADLGGGWRGGPWTNAFNSVHEVIKLSYVLLTSLCTSQQ